MVRARFVPYSSLTPCATSTHAHSNFTAEYHRAGNTGGVFWVTGGPAVSIGADATFQHNYAANGGAFLIDGVATTLSFGDNLLVRNNTADAHVAWIQNCNTDVTFGINTRFEDNTASSSGGGALSITGTKNVTFSSAVAFVRNTGMNGGAVFLDNSKLTLPDGSAFISNTAQNIGGGISCLSAVSVTMGRWVHTC